MAASPSPPAAPSWPQLGLAGLLAAQAAQAPEAPWLLGPQGEVISWGDAQMQAGAWAQAWGLKAGELVALSLPQGAELALALWACWQAGALPCIVPSSLPKAAQALRLAAIGPGLRQLHEAPAGQGLKGPGVSPQAQPGLSVARPLAPHALAQGQPVGAGAEGPEGLGPEALGLLVASSGSSGAPTLVAWRGGAMAWNALAHAQALGLPPQARVMASGPWASAFPLVAELLAPWLLGGAAVLPPGPFAPKAWLAHAKALGVAHLALPPPQFDLAMALVRRPDGLPPLLSTGAMPVAGPKLLAMAAWAQSGGARFAYTYGLSEAGPRVATAFGADLEADPEGGLRPLPGLSLALVPSPEMPREADGALWVRSPSRAAGLWEAGALLPWEEASPFAPPGLEGGRGTQPLAGQGPGGWLDTGDWGAWGPDGALRLVGRRKATILVGGASVGAETVEKALLQDPKVQAACVVATFHPSYGEAPLAYVEAGIGYDAEAARTALLGLLAREALPLRIEVVQALPRLPNGKVDRMAVKAWGSQA